MSETKWQETTTDDGTYYATYGPGPVSVWLDGDLVATAPQRNGTSGNYMVTLFDGTDAGNTNWLRSVVAIVAQALGSTVVTDTTPTPEIQLCGHSFCEDYRRGKITTDDGARWCHMGHGKAVALSAADWSTVMSGLASGAREAYEQGYMHTSVHRWEALAAIESALGLESDAAKTRQLILATELPTR